ncbi:efflux RND transporter periplasmic adaptor subunit [Thorsellia anophelis]|uniref:RND family efflux transporter, MFP subunit n=1 Tax=Thorsellia anophelis DSM 18579 TaxID=1123402 RepID=A0A1I0EIH0_9GAMM|nr:efflux RND transporter periplasmic adaptor subunit [Thorsellia anophelis]SET44940.1 RND family efflux transporter, MFP subunit [Thorsellia anophelis DSM 18579]
MKTENDSSLTNEMQNPILAINRQIKQSGIGKKILRGIIWIIFLMLLIVGIVMIFNYLGSRPEPEVALPPPITVSTAVLKEGSITPKYSFIGEIKAKQTASVSVEVNNARILSLPVDAGTYVKTGDILAILDNQTLQYQRDQAASNFEQARDEYQRKTRLGSAGGISQEQLVSSRTAMESAKARLDDAELTLSKSTLRSPVDGIIITRHQDIGSLANPTSPLFTIAVDGLTEFVAKVPENQLQLFSIGQIVNIQLSGQPEPLSGKIRLIEPLINATERTANLYLSFDDATFKPIGLFGMANIELADKTGLIVPTTAILLDEQGNYIWTVNAESKIDKTYIKEISRQDNQAIIELVQLNTPIKTDSQIHVVLRAGTLINEGDIVNSFQLDSITSSN